MATMDERARATAARRKEMIGLRRKGLSNHEIAESLGVTQRVVATELYRAKRDDGMDVPKSPYRVRSAGDTARKS